MARYPLLVSCWLRICHMTFLIQIIGKRITSSVIYVNKLWRKTKGQRHCFSWFLKDVTRLTTQRRDSIRVSKWKRLDSSRHFPGEIQVWSNILLFSFFRLFKNFAWKVPYIILGNHSNDFHKTPRNMEINFQNSDYHPQNRLNSWNCTWNYMKLQVNFPRLLNSNSTSMVYEMKMQWELKWKLTTKPQVLVYLGGDKWI